MFCPGVEQCIEKIPVWLKHIFKQRKISLTSDVESEHKDVFSD